MNSVELIKKICKERKIPISRLERELGYGNGYIGQLKKGTIPSDRAIEIANFLEIDLSYLLSGGDKKTEEPALTAKDERDIARDLDRIMGEIRRGDDGPLYYNGMEIDDASVNLLQNAIEYALRETKKENKVKYNPYKNKK
jgi:transcriptional regulator with XRE-family HTH domain